MSLWPTRAMRVPKMVEANLPQERRDFYVYVIFRPDGTPCYVGKGQRDRWVAHARKSHNRALNAIYAAAGGSLPIIKVREGLTDPEACEIEMHIIVAIGRANLGEGPLVNLTDGGEGVAGYVPTEDHRNKVRLALAGRERPPEIGEAVRKAAAWDRPEWREKQRDSHLGKTQTIEQRTNHSIASLQKNGRTLADIGAPGFAFTPFQRKLLNKPAMTRAEMGERLSQRNIGNNYGIGNKRTPEGEAAVAASVAETNRRRNKSGNPTVWKDKQTPWVELGMSRTTWFRKRSKAPNGAIG